MGDSDSLLGHVVRSVVGKELTRESLAIWAGWARISPHPMN